MIDRPRHTRTLRRFPRSIPVKGLGCAHLPRRECVLDDEIRAELEDMHTGTVCGSPGISRTESAGTFFRAGRDAGWFP
jgi:hypothetical protein